MESTDGEVGLPELGWVADGLGAVQRGPERSVGLIPLPTRKGDLTLETPAAHQVLARIGSGCELQALLRELQGFRGIPARQPELTQAREKISPARYYASASPPNESSKQLICRPIPAGDSNPCCRP
jgi:hypothetical protein